MHEESKVVEITCRDYGQKGKLIEEVVHNNPHFYDHTIQCKRCGCNKMDKKDL